MVPVLEQERVVVLLAAVQLEHLRNVDVEVVDQRFENFAHRRAHGDVVEAHVRGATGAAGVEPVVLDDLDSGLLRLIDDGTAGAGVEARQHDDCRIVRDRLLRLRLLCRGVVLGVHDRVVDSGIAERLVEVRAVVGLPPRVSLRYPGARPRCSCCSLRSPRSPPWSVSPELSSSSPPQPAATTASAATSAKRANHTRRRLFSTDRRSSIPALLLSISVRARARWSDPGARAWVAPHRETQGENNQIADEKATWRRRSTLPRPRPGSLTTPASTRSGRSATSPKSFPSVSVQSENQPMPGTGMGVARLAAELAHARVRGVDVVDAEVRAGPAGTCLLRLVDRAALRVGELRHVVLARRSLERLPLPAEERAPELPRLRGVARRDLQVHYLSWHDSSFDRATELPLRRCLHYDEPLSRRSTAALPLHHNDSIGGDVAKPGRAPVRIADDELADGLRATEPEVHARVFRRQVARAGLDLPHEPSPRG